MVFFARRLMRLSIKKSDQQFTELHFKTGPIYLGRHVHSQVFLPAAGVSRQHAVLYTSQDGTWLIEDLDSANKTFLNGSAVHKSDIKDADTITIAEFTIDIAMADEVVEEQAVHKDDTMVHVKHDIPTVIRHAFSKKGQPVKFPASREKDFSKATQMLARAQSLKQLHREILDVLHAQFSARDAWACLRNQPDGPMQCHGGRKISSEIVKRSDLLMQADIADAMDKREHILVPQIPREIAQGKIRSAIITPILIDKDCHGAIYADNSREHEHYTLADLDYLMLIAIHTAAIMKKLP